jgi:hypothetical protein
MSTDRYYLCGRCEKRSKAPKLFNALKKIAAGEAPPGCTDCGAEAKLHLDFAPGIQGRERRKCAVLDAFVPRNLGTPEGREGSIDFYPFLVVLEVEDGGQRVWLPYWHVMGEEGKRRAPKYGQWAPRMDVVYFRDLLDQACEKGCEFAGGRSTAAGE